MKSRLSRGISIDSTSSGHSHYWTRAWRDQRSLLFEQVEGYLSSSVHGDRTIDRIDTRFGAIAATVDPRALFALRVKGDSMTGAGILDGDLVVLFGRKSSAKNGDIVVARLAQEEATVKRLVRKPGLIHLAPENSKYKPIPVDENTEIIGKVIRVVRHYN